MPQPRSPRSALDLIAMKQAGRRIVMLTCYDALFARLLREAGVDLMLVGDSVNQVLRGESSTLSATVDQMIYHARSVMRGSGDVPVYVDMPFLSYQISAEEALRSAGRIMKETGAHGVKLEGGSSIAPAVKVLVEAGIPVMGHLGLTPQSVHALGGYRVQGREPAVAERILEDARTLEAAGVFAIVLELVPGQVSERISRSLTVPTIGIGAGPHCDGQVLVLHDMLGLNDAFQPKFLKHFASMADTVRKAVAEYADEVRTGTYPGPDHTFE